MATKQERDGEPEIREQYNEFRVGESVVAVISDPENSHAWIQCDVQAPIQA